LNKINTYILTGFLGAGKTTVLNHLLKQVANNKNVIVENEFGKVNVDKQLVEQKYDQLYELTNGCICCTYDEGFFVLLNELYSKKNEIDHLFIETTGVADVSPIITLFNRPDVKNHFTLINTICVADAEVVEDYLKEFSEVEKQLVVADIIIINKSNQVNPIYSNELQQKILFLNPLAKLLTTGDGFIDFQKLNSSNHKIEIHKHQTKHQHHTHSNIGTHLFETDKAIDIQAFQAVLSITMLVYNHQIYRVKGFIKAHDGNTYLFQSAGKGISLEPFTNKNIDKTQLVFIGKNIEHQSIERIMKQTIYKPNKIKTL
jgi:G3E family GTPase